MGNVLLVAEMYLYLDAFGKAIFEAFSADGKQHSTTCAELEEFPNARSGVTSVCINVGGGQQSTPCAEPQRIFDACSGVTLGRFIADSIQQSTPCAGIEGSSKPVAK